VITVIAPGPLSTVQDLGRPGFGHLGISRSGAADRPAHLTANSIVGNEASDATIEMTLGRLRVRFTQDTVIALAGADCEAEVAGESIPMYRAAAVRAGQEVRVGAPRTGLRTYLAVRGGITVPAVLGSRSTDTLSGIGPAPLAAGAVLPVGTADATGSRPAHRSLLRSLRRTSEAVDKTTRDAPTDGDGSVLTLIPGPRQDWFTPEALTTLCSFTWTVTVDANRVGVRLSGPVLERARSDELPSEAMVAGALQVPPSGQPVLFLADHPVTGGYPVIAVVTEEGLSVAAQLRPGQGVRFRVR
jgi:biotin-dependent carboxylase-like uncharacterized protein